MAEIEENQICINQLRDEMIRRKPCPFCGEKNIAISRFLNHGRKMFELHCPKCNAHSGVSENEDNAIRHWNNRAIEDRLLSEGSCLYAALRKIAELRNLNPDLKYQDNPPCAESAFANLYCRMGDIAILALGLDPSETSAPSIEKE